MWVLLYAEGLPQTFDAAQWALMITLTFAGLLATAITWYIDYGANKQPVKYQCCNCDEMFNETEVYIGEDATLCHNCDRHLTHITEYN